MQQVTLLLILLLWLPNTTPRLIDEAPTTNPPAQLPAPQVNPPEQPSHTQGSHFCRTATPGGRPSRLCMVAGLFVNSVFLSAFASFFLAQTTKIFTYRCTDGKWDVARVLTSGGMPSSHAAFVTGLTVGVGVQEGLDSAVFAVALVFSLIVMYDATGVRLHAGRQATALNIIISEMPPDHPIQDNGRLRDSLGHTKAQVTAGVLLGITVGSIVQLIAR